MTGLAETAKGLGGFLMGPLALLGAGLGIAESIRAADQLSQTTKKLDAVLQATGNTTGFTRSQLMSMAEDLQKVTNFSEKTTIGAEAMLATFHNIGGDTFKAALHAAMDLTSVMGGDLNQNIVKVGRALDNPIAGMKALSRLGVTFSEQQKKSIASMMASGNLGGAQQMILGQLQGKFGGAAEAMASPFVQFRNKLESLAESIGGILRPIAVVALRIFGPMVDGITATLKTIIPTVEYVVGIIGNLFSAGVQFMGSVIAPAWGAFTGFLGTAFSGFLDYLEAVLPAALGMLGQFFDTALAFGEMLWDGLATVFTSIANIIGTSSESSSKSMASMGSVFTEIGADISAVMLVLEFGFSHWADIGALGLVSLEYHAVKLWNQIEYGGEVVGQFLGWFGQNWFNIFRDAGSIVATVASNIWENLKSLWDAIVGLFEGKGFDFEPTNLLKGFKSALTEMPQIAARVAGGTETALGQEMGSISDSLNKSFASFIDTRTAQNVAAAQKLHDATKGLFDKLKHPDLPKMPKIALPGAGSLPTNQLLAGGDEGAKVGALVKGSAEAYKAEHSSSAPLAQLNDTAQKQLDQQKKTNALLGGNGDDNDDGDSIPG